MIWIYKTPGNSIHLRRLRKAHTRPTLQTWMMQPDYIDMGKIHRF